MPVINLDKNTYTFGENETVNLHGLDDDAINDDYLLTENESTLGKFVIGSETFISLDLNDDGEEDLFGKLSTDDQGRKYVDLAEDDGSLRINDADTVTITSDSTPADISAAIDLITRNLSSGEQLTPEQKETLTQAAVNSFGSDDDNSLVITPAQAKDIAVATEGGVTLLARDMTIATNEDQE